MVQKPYSVPQAAAVIRRSGALLVSVIFSVTPNWFEPGCAQCYLPRVLAYTMMYGGVDPSIADSNALEIYDYGKYSHIQTSGAVGNRPFLLLSGKWWWSSGMSLRAKGVKTVVVDPRLTPDAAKADIWLPIRPGT